MTGAESESVRVAVRVAVCVRSITFDEGAGGLERAAADQIKSMLERDVEVTLIAPIGDMTYRPAGLTVVDVPWPSWSSQRGPLFSAAYVWWTRRARRALQHANPDIALLHGGAAGVLRGPDREQFGFPAIANPHGMEEFSTSPRIRWLFRTPTRILSRRARYASRIISTDEGLREAVQRNFRVPAAKIVSIPNFVDDDWLRGLASQAGEKRGGYVIVTIGRLVRNKGYDLLAEALSSQRVQEVLPQPWAWKHFGSGEERDRLISLARGSGSLNLTIYSERSDQEVQSALATCDLFIQPSRYEGSSLTTLEAMSHGRTVVGTPVGGIPDKIDDGVTGFLAKAVSAEALADAIGRAISYQGRSVGERAQRRVRERFSREASADAYAKIFDELRESEGEMPQEANPNRAPRIVQLVREFGHGSGVGGVAASLDEVLTKRGFVVENVSLESMRARSSRKSSGLLRSKLSLFGDVAWFSIIGTIRARRAYHGDPDVIVISHNDAVYGDIQVNHGLLKEAMRQRHGRKIFVPANPMHWFTLIRDELRYSSSVHTAVVSLTQRDADNLGRLYPRLRSSAVVVPNGIDPLRFRDSELGDRQHLRQNLNLTPEDHIALFVGHEFERKGLWIAIDAIGELPEVFHLIVVGGTGRTLDAARERIRIMGLADRVHMVGRQRDPRPFFGASDSFVLPSSYEANALALLEALASGLPCLATDVGAAGDLIADGRNGYIVEPDSKEIASRLQKIRSVSDSDRGSVAQACRESVADYSWESIGKSYADLIGQVWAKKRARVGQ